MSTTIITRTCCKCLITTSNFTSKHKYCRDCRRLVNNSKYLKITSITINKCCPKCGTINDRGYCKDCKSVYNKEYYQSKLQQEQEQFLKEKCHGHVMMRRYRWRYSAVCRQVYTSSRSRLNGFYRRRALLVDTVEKVRTSREHSFKRYMES